VPTDQSSETALVRRAQGGDADAVAEIYQLHSPAIFRYFYFRLPDREAAEDLTGAVFLQMIEALPRYEDRGLPFAAWLFRIAHDRLVDHHRRSAYRQSGSLSEQVEDAAADTEGLAMRSHEEQGLRALISELTGEQRMVVQLRFIEGYNLQETAEVMGKSPGAIKALQHRALRQLARKLNRS
jgi:RNA polymerase sigma-70 factor (ECF subfamily)